jgi:hypothetical protein
MKPFQSILILTSVFLTGFFVALLAYGHLGNQEQPAPVPAAGDASEAGAFEPAPQSMALQPGEPLAEATLRASETEAEADELAEAEPLAPGWFESLAMAFPTAEAWDLATAEVAFMTPEEALNQLAMLERFPDSPNKDALKLNLIEQLAEGDSAAAIEQALALDGDQLQHQGLQYALTGWARTQPDAALAWLRQNESSYTRNQFGDLLVASMRGHAQGNPHQAMLALVALPEASVSNRDFARAVGLVVQGYLNTASAGQAMAAVTVLPQGRARTEGLEALANEFGKRDPSLGANLMHQLAGSPGFRSAQEAYVRGLNDRSSIQAAAYLDTLEGGATAHPNLINITARRWSENDLPAASNWLNQFEPSPQIDRAVMSISFRSAHEDPAGAMSWAESVVNERRRLMMMGQVAARWLQSDPQGLEQYLASTNLTEEQKQRLRDTQPWGGR